MLGIDLGTSTAKVAVVERGRPRLLRIDGVPLMPAAVAIGGDGCPWVGYPAYRQLKMDPSAGVRGVKPRLGEEISLALGAVTCSPQEIAALILGRLRQVAEETLKVPVSRAVIAVPACYSDMQRRAIRSAGELAGLKVLRLVNEAAAAALARAVSEPASRLQLVYDLGGGCFDCAVVRRDPQRVALLATQGDARLGGDALDARLMDYALAQLTASQEIDPRDDFEAMARLRLGCEAARVALTETERTWIEVSELRGPDGRLLQWSLPLTRAICDELVAATIEPTLAAVTAVLETAGVAHTELDEVLVLGGVSRMPLVQQRLERLLGLGACAGVDPELSVAAGAALLGAALDGQPGVPELVDVTGHTLGTSALGDRDGAPYLYTYVPLIQRNTPIPVARSEAFSTIDDGQRAIDVHIYQGEDPDALKNTEIGTFRIEGLSDVPAGNLLVMTFRLDANGLLSVSAREQQTGLVKQVSIDNASSRFAATGFGASRHRLAALLAGRSLDEVARVVEAEAAAAAAKEAEAAAAAVKEAEAAAAKEAEESAARAQAAATVAAAESESRLQAAPTAVAAGSAADAEASALPDLLERVTSKAERLLPGANAEDRADLTQLLTLVYSARAQGDAATLERAGAALTDLVYFLET